MDQARARKLLLAHSHLYELRPEISKVINEAIQYGYRMKICEILNELNHLDAPAIDINASQQMTESYVNTILERFDTYLYFVDFSDRGTKSPSENLPGERPERKRAEIAAVFVLSKEDVEQVLGSGWMEGRLIEGDVCMCIKHGVDCFNKYILLELNENAVRGIPESEFGSYVLSPKPLHWKPTPEEFAKLCAGGYSSKELDKHPLVAEVESLRDKGGVT